MYNLVRYNALKIKGQVQWKQMSSLARHFAPVSRKNQNSNTSPTAQIFGNGNQQKPRQPHQGVNDEGGVSSCWQRKVFSGIQPTGALHLGNYLGAVRKWTEMQNAQEDVTVCIVDMHSITMPHNPPILRENIFKLAATLLACGLDTTKTTLFVQSSVLEHCELNWILSSLTNMPRLAQLPQYKEKSRTLRDVPLGLYVYPVLQAADIMLYKSTHVPVGVDQLQHIQLAQHLARSFNARYGETFPVCQAMIEQNNASRVLSLRDPSKKMSKSDLNQKSTIYVSDPPEVIMEKIKKAITDFTSDITFNPESRPGVSNLVNIHSQVTNQSIDAVVNEANALDTARYKERVADAVIEHLRPIREQIDQHLAKRNELIYMLEIGAQKARQRAQQTMSEVKQRLGLGTNTKLPAPVELAPLLPQPSKMTASQRMLNVQSNLHYEQTSEAEAARTGGSSITTAGELVQESIIQPNYTWPTVPMQRMRVEKQRNFGPPKYVFKMDTCNAPVIGFKAPPIPPAVASGVTSSLKHKREKLGFSGTQYASSMARYKGGSQNIQTSTVAAKTSMANAAKYQQDIDYSLANNSAFCEVTASANGDTTLYNNNSLTPTTKGDQKATSLKTAIIASEKDNVAEEEENEDEKVSSKKTESSETNDELNCEAIKA